MKILYNTLSNISLIIFYLYTYIIGFSRLQILSIIYII